MLKKTPSYVDEIFLKADHLCWKAISIAVSYSDLVTDI